jgi:hypothetical protein
LQFRERNSEIYKKLMVNVTASYRKKWKDHVDERDEDRWLKTA